MREKKGVKKFLLISIILCLVSMIGASFVQTSGGDVTIKDLRWETPSGHLMSALLLIPENATEETPAPGLVTSHGWYNNREMQDLNYVEMARRGYVVMSIDMYGHGNSDIVEPSEWPNRGTGMYDAVELLADLPYVDTASIGVTGHSNGARAANWSILEDNKKSEEDQLISSVLLVANDAMYTADPGEPLYWAMRSDEQEYANVYGSRDVGIVAAQYDEFFFRSIADDGSITVPREYINTQYAQSFLNFGEDPAEAEERESYTVYRQDIDGEEAVRVIYDPAQIHPWNHFSANVVESTLEFFDESIGAPNSIDTTKQIWQFKVLFNFIGLIGFVMFIISFTKFMLYTDTFHSLRAQKSVIPQAAPRGAGALWFWGGLIVSAIISGLSYLGLYNWSIENIPAFYNQVPVFYIGVWSAVMGVVTFLVLFLSYKFFSKGQGMNLRDTGVIIGFKPLLKTIALALIVCFTAFSLVFIADYFFKTDFRIWIIAVKAFTPDKLLIVLKYLPFFLAFYVANSIAVNSFNFVAGGRKKWMNIALLALFNGLSVTVLAVIQYTSFFVTGEIYFTELSPIIGIWLLPMIIIIPLAAIVTRRIYLATNNPYLGGIIYGIVVTVIMVTNTLTQL
ncbi:dienelactone hydrolase family protein [Jeotgalibacillus campisalis]|uniref:Membrane protein n=1 Tax=Jeotgalibacillus campisalis TaxID=220754 RepID=A0A0C2VPN4_9BACL|nr:CocE/NonD family hydrolase [Jeotgalibacillus campisalis]KIL46401.1 membrane protein [Jeotgalibacillus campisalis]